MDLSLTQIFTALVGSATLLFSIVFLTARKSKTAHPVFCAHCWVHAERKTVVTFAEEENQWAICPRCTRHYWQFR